MLERAAKRDVREMLEMPREVLEIPRDAKRDAREM
jgi:hypothetical protein